MLGNDVWNCSLTHVQTRGTTVLCTWSVYCSSDLLMLGHNVV